MWRCNASHTTLRGLTTQWHSGSSDSLASDLCATIGSPPETYTVQGLDAAAGSASLLLCKTLGDTQMGYKDARIMCSATGMEKAA